MSMNFDKYSKRSKIIASILVILLIYWVHYLTKSKAPALPTPIVTVKKPILAEMAEYITQTGTTVALNSVDLVARIEGYLDAIEFTDGTFVNQGKELFVIQPEPYLEKLKAAQATVAAQKANYAYAKSEYARQKKMYKDNATSLNSVEIWLAKMQEAEAEVAKAVADAEIAAINYSYTHIAAPFTGRIGRHLVDKGNLVGNGKATTLATIEQMDTLYVYFNLNEIDLVRLRSAALAKGFKNKDLHQIPVEVSMQNTKDYTRKATLDFVNTGLNASTGTMELRALLDNKDYLYVPGLFVQVRIAITKPSKQLTVPDTAVLYDQIGPYLLTVDNNNIVVLSRVTLGGVEQGMRAVVSGLHAQDRVIIGGLQNASPGNKVDPQEQTSEQTAK